MEHFHTRTMTNVFRLDSDTSFRGLLPPEDDAFLNVARQFDGNPIGGSWIPLTVEYDPESSDLPISDFPTLTLPHIPVFSRLAVEALEPLLKANGELLPLNTPDDAQFFAFNVTSVVSALSPQSQIVYYPSGRILDVKQYVLDETRLTHAAIFKLPETVLMDVFVNDEFVALVERANLRGFSFESVAVE